MKQFTHKKQITNFAQNDFRNSNLSSDVFEKDFVFLNNKNELRLSFTIIAAKCGGF